MDNNLFYYIEDFYGGLIIPEDDIELYDTDVRWTICYKGTMSEIKEYLHGDNEENDIF